MDGCLKTFVSGLILLSVTACQTRNTGNFRGERVQDPTRQLSPTPSPSPLPNQGGVGGVGMKEGHESPQGGFFVGAATHFGAVAPDGGGCGTPPDLMIKESQGRFVALNVQDTPGDYRNDPVGRKPRPNLSGTGLGMFANGRHCGRWIKVILDDVCSGMSDGTAGKPLCQNGSYKPDDWNGASQYFLVSDSCQDDNAWCRDDPYHVDLATSGLNTFTKDGRKGEFKEWRNRRVKWNFVPAPDYKGDLWIGFVKDSFISSTSGAWVALIVMNLPNGISRVEAKNLGSQKPFVPLRMVSDNGQKFEGLPTESDEWLLRVFDSAGELINIGGKPFYRLKFPCGKERCRQLFNEPKGGYQKQSTES